MQVRASERANERAAGPRSELNCAARASQVHLRKRAPPCCTASAYQANSALTDAQTAVDSALADFNRAQTDAQNALSNAQASFDDADRAFQAAKAKAYADLDSAKAAVQSAQDS